MKTKRKPSVVIAVPAYNEESNILMLLDSIYSQKTTRFHFHEVWVYSDGSTDATVRLVKERFRSVKIKDFKVNLGKNIRVNQILKANTADILIQVDADIKLGHSQVFDEMVKKFSSEPKIGIVCAYHLATKPQNLVEELGYFGFRVWDSARGSLGKRGIRYYCEGGMRAFSKEFTTVFRLPTDKHIGEDSYSFYFAKQNNFSVVVSKKSKVYIDLPHTIIDYVRQMKRFLLDPQMVGNTFDESLVVRYETMTLGVKINALIKEFVKTPLIGALYFLLQAYTKAQMVSYKPAKNWAPIERKKA